MPVPNLDLPPDQNGYRADWGQTGIATKLDGGASRFRADQLGAAFTVAVQWTMSRQNYEYLLAFYRTTLNLGANAFTIDLILDQGIPTTYTCHILPGTLSLTQQLGETYIVSATLEADYDPSYALDDATILAAGPDV
jgi:hypothetical protein